ncbi:MAG: hypothetical protein RL616_1686 [Verrucomicrobiota bacterium]
MKNINLLALTVSVLTVADLSQTLACDCCSVFSVCNLQAENSKGFVAGVAEQYTHFGTLQDESRRVGGSGEYIDSLTSQIFAGYHFNERFSAQLNLPVIYRAYGSHTASADTAGIGDISLVGNFRAFQFSRGNFSFNWTVLGGIKLPTGDSALLALDDADLPDGIGGHDLALGSGSVDGIVGTGFSARWKRIFLNGQMQYAIRTQGDFGHRYANDWTWSGGPGAFVWLGEKATVAVQVVTSGESKDMDTFGGETDADSAATLVYLGPQLNFTWGGSLSAQVGADLPVSLANSGLQVVPDYRIHAAMTWKF